MSGANIYLGQQDSKASFGDRIAPMGRISFGKWITPWFGARIGVAGYMLKGFSETPIGYNVHKTMDKNGLYSQKWSAISPQVDMMINLSNLFSHYNPKRVYEPILYVGIGGMIALESGSNSCLSGSLGLINKFRVSDAVNLTLNLESSMINNDFDGKIGTYGDGLLGVTLGVTYKFKTREFRRAGVVYREKVVYDNDAVNELREKVSLAKEQLTVTEDQLSTANRKIAELEIAKQVQPESKNELPKLTIYFSADSWSVSKRDQALLKGLALEMSANKTTKYLICGYADDKTGTLNVNQALREKRAQEVINILVKRFGVNAAQLVKETNASKLSSDGYYAFDRAVTIQEEK